MRVSRVSILKHYFLLTFLLLPLTLLAEFSPPLTHEPVAAKAAMTLAAAPQSTNPAVVGQWNTSVIPFKTVPLHISLLPNGKILYWGRDKVMNGSNLEDVRGHSNTYVVDPQYFFNDPWGHTTTFYNSTTNLFCSGHSFLPDGRLLVTGGHDKDDFFGYAEGLGERAVNIFDYNNTVSPWTKHTVGMALGRWYPYNVTLANGDVAILGGTYWSNRDTPEAQPIPRQNPNPEKYTFDPNGQGNIAIYQPDQQPYAPVESYPLAHLIPDGRILISGPSTRVFDPNDADQNGPLGHFVNYPYSFQSLPPGSTKYTGSSALYDLAAGKILVMGGAPGVGGTPVREAVVTDTSIHSDWMTAGAMAFKRKFHTATILPDGKVLVSGGTQCPGANDIICPDYPNLSNGAAVINPELWSPNSPTTWTTMAASPSATPRVYHSIALLLPDATVLVGAGGLPGAYGEVDPTTNQGRGFGHSDAEIFSPPYLFDASGQPAARPVITSLQTNRIGLGQSMQVGFTSTTSISSVVLIRLGSVTHGTNQDQRRIPLNFNLSGSNLSVTIPATGQVCPPGPYMLFILNANGTPSVARMLTVTTGSQTIPSTDLVAYWKFDENSGTTAADSSGSGHAGTLVNGTAWAAGRIGTALSFDGVDDMVSTNGIANVTNNFTLAFWALPTASHEIDPESTTIISGTSGQRYAFWPTWYDTGHAGAGVSVGTNGVSVYEHAGGYMPATLVFQTSITTWTHIAIVYENKQPKLYINGVLVRSGLTSPRDFVHLNPTFMGGQSYGYFGGRLDEVRAYSRALSASEISALLSSTPPPPSSDIVWVEDSVPAGGVQTVDNDSWSWINTNPSPVSGNLSHQSSLVAGMHQHYFTWATNTLSVNAGEKLIAYVYIDPANPPSEVMLQWCSNQEGWNHRAYWGANQIAWGTDGTTTLFNKGPLPVAGQWVRLEVPASQVGLEGKTLHGMAFTLFGGRANWDRAGKSP